MLGAPEIIGKLSECSLGVQFHKLVPGATARLLTVGGALIDEWPASRADEAFDFHPGHHVAAGTDVRATQVRPGEGGLLSAVAHVGGKPSPAGLSAGGFAKPLYECGECVWLFNLFAGATVRVFSHGTEALGEAVVRPDGQAHVGLKRPLTPKDELTAVQTACAALGGPVASAVAIVGGSPVSLDGLTLPQTQVAAVRACGTALYFEKVMNGASVTVTRTPAGGAPSTYGPQCLPVSPFTLWGYAPFQPGEALDIQTRLEKCQRSVGVPVKLVADPDPPDPPHFLTAVCSDSTGVLFLGGLELNAQVEITVTPPGPAAAVTLVFGAGAPQDHFNLSLGQAGAPKLVPGAEISVRQNLCGGPGGWSKPATAKVLAAAPKVPAPSLPHDHATLSTLTPTLTWHDTGSAPCSQATKFDVRVGTTPVMAAADVVFAPATGVPGTSVGVPGGVLKASTTYYWQVRAYHGGLTSAWSALFQFATSKDRTTPTPTPTGDQTFVFCQLCPGFDQGKTITVTAPDYATAEAKAMAHLPSGCFLSPGKCT